MTRLAAVALTLLIAACGESAPRTSGGAGDQPVQAPAARSPHDGAGAKPATPTHCGAVSRRLVGRSLRAAHASARGARCALRVVIEDGRPLPVTEDFNPDRINVRVDHGEVRAIVGRF